MNYTLKHRPKVHDIGLNYEPLREGAIGLSLLGKGYIGFGNNDQDHSLGDLLEFDPQGAKGQGEWKRIWREGDTPGHEPPARKYPFSFSIKNFIYVGTGSGAAGYLNDFWRFDIIAKT